MGRVWIDIAMEDIDTDDLIDELENRYLDEQEMATLAQLLKTNAMGGKMELFLKVMHRYSLLELEAMFKEDLSVKNIPEQQLAIFQPPSP